MIMAAKKLYRIGKIVTIMGVVAIGFGTSSAKAKPEAGHSAQGVKKPFVAADMGHETVGAPVKIGD
jgi:hypothetical protein